MVSGQDQGHGEGSSPLSAYFRSFPRVAIDSHRKNQRINKHRSGTSSRRQKGQTARKGGQFFSCFWVLCLICLQRKWPEEKLPVGLESLRNFNVRAKVVGPQGSFVKYIQQETGTRVQIKGLGSGFIDQETGRESDEPLYIHITYVDPHSY